MNLSGPNRRLFDSLRFYLIVPLALMLLLVACDPNAAEPLRILAPSANSANTIERPPLAPPAAGTTVDFDPAAQTIALVPVVEGLQTPVFVTHAGDDSDRLFVVEKAGVIQIVTPVDGIGTLGAEPFLDISERVTTGGNEQGLLGLAFAPDYAESGYFFVNYSDLNGDTVVARYQRTADNPNRADPDSEFVILQIEQPARNHNGGMLAFGPDGYLYIGTGDGGGSGDRYENGQNPDSLLGKMLRIDVTSDPSQPYQIPADNPWVDADWNGTDVRDEIWAVGLRNPWRYSFDRTTGDLWIGDVGQNQYEEISIAPRPMADSVDTDEGNTGDTDTTAAFVGGDNYGWPIMEGTHCYRDDDCDPTGLVIPVAEYDHSGHCSVTGGYVYRGSEFPDLAGVYLFGDYCSGMIWATWPTADGWQTAELLDSDVMISSFGEDAAGELYLTHMSGGQLLQLTLE